jgi:hypothetical protein
MQAQIVGPTMEAPIHMLCFLPDSVAEAPLTLPLPFVSAACRPTSTPSRARVHLHLNFEFWPCKLLENKTFSTLYTPPPALQRPAHQDGYPEKSIILYHFPGTSSSHYISTEKVAWTSGIVLQRKKDTEHELRLNLFNSTRNTTS